MRQLLRKVVKVVALVMVLGPLNAIILGQFMVLEARASYRTQYGLKDALSTVGIATGIGTVIGLSTIAFYESPASHFENALMGAGAGLLLGIGAAVYLYASAPDSDEIGPEEFLPPGNKLNDSEKKPRKDSVGIDWRIYGPKKVRFARFGLVNRHLPLMRQSLSQALVPATFAHHRQLAKNWSVALNVLELRF